MIKVENIETWGFKHAIRGMRNPMNSWDKSDSYDNYSVEYEEDGEEVHHPYYRVGASDLDLMRRLYKAGTEHRKYLRQIVVSMDITAPLYWWKEFDTYKIGTVANSCSTMHKIHAKEFTIDDFSHEHLSGGLAMLACTIDILNIARGRFLNSKDKSDWWHMILLLPSSYNQKRSFTMNYENVVTMIRQRTGHKLDEWNDFVALLHGLPYVAEIIDE